MDMRGGRADQRWTAKLGGELIGSRKGRRLRGFDDGGCDY
jgi:hypothetical protein